jgi:hypothetical protein
MHQSFPPHKYLVMVATMMMKVEMGRRHASSKMQRYYQLSLHSRDYLPLVRLQLRNCTRLTKESLVRSLIGPFGINTYSCSKQIHLISSTATFTLLSPLPDTTLYITSLSATAFYNHTEPVGTIDYPYQLAVPPGASQTPKLPVEWSLGGAGYSAVRDALGGTLKLDAEADVGVRIGAWHEKVWFKGGGIGASVRL